ncbi:MAG: gamma-glutamyl-gamma-aminobutyrate hydrolase family protein [Nanoarchaeota archaeon]
MILVISTCKYKLHELEFVKPVEDVLKETKKPYVIRHYTQLNKNNIDKADKIIICGTSLQDFNYVEKINKFSWINNINKPVLGICAGMQILGLVYNGINKKKTEVGFYKEKFNKNFLNIKENTEIEVYHLHNNYIDFLKLNEFETYCKSNGIAQAVKHKQKPLFGVLFHPEVRNKEIILNFVR